MAASQKTDLGLNQWIGSDTPSMDDFNKDNRIIDEELIKRPVLSVPITKTVNIANLQDEIDALPKMLMANVTFNINGGTYSGDITIGNFFGSGILTIKGASEIATTHNIAKLIIYNCSIPRIDITGFNMTTISGNAMYVNLSSSVVYLQYMSATAGSSSTSGFYGIRVTDNSGLVYIEYSTISNKNRAVTADYMSYLCVSNLAGTNNNAVYRASVGARIHKRIDGTISGTTIDSLVQGAIIVNSSGGVIG